MKIIHKRRLKPDSWTRLSLHDAPSTGASVIVDLDTLNKDPETWIDWDGAWGLSVSGETAFDALDQWLGRIRLLEIRIPKFTDGRGYSLAKRVRRSGYEGELRAAGDILQDQLAYLERCGFDSFSSETIELTEDMLVAFDEISRPYQASASDPDASWRRFG